MAFDKQLAAAIVRRCIVSVLLSWVVAGTDLYVIVKTWKLHARCNGLDLSSDAAISSTGVGHAIHVNRSNFDAVKLDRQFHKECSGWWGNYVVFYNYSVWASVATAAFVAGPLLEAIVDVAILHQQNISTSAAAMGAQFIAVVASLGLSVKMQRLLGVHQARKDATLLTANGRQRIAHMYSIKVVEVVTKGIMVVFAVSLYSVKQTTKLDYNIDVFSESNPPAAVARGLLETTMHAASRSAVQQTTILQRDSGVGAYGVGGYGVGAYGVDVTVGAYGGSLSLTNVSVPVGISGNARRQEMPLDWVLIVEVVLALFTAANAAAGFSWYCSASAWSIGTTTINTSHVQSHRPGFCSHLVSFFNARLPFAFFPLFVFECAAIFCGGTVYAYLAQHLWAMLKDPRMALLLLMGRWLCQVALLWILCMWHNRSAYAFGAAIWKGLLSSVAFIPWSLSGHSQWGWAFWGHVVLSTAFAVVGNGVMIYKSKGVGVTKTNFSNDWAIPGLVVGLLLPAVAAWLNSRLWQRNRAVDFVVPDDAKM